MSEPCDDGRHVVVLDDHGAGRCACGMVTRLPRPLNDRLPRCITPKECDAGAECVVSSGCRNEDES